MKEQIRLVPTITAGVIVGVIEVVIATSFAALVFAGPLAEHIPRGIGLMLVAATLMLLTVSVLTSIPGAIGSLQDGPAAIAALMAAGIAARVGGGERGYDTVVAALCVSSLAAGAFFFALGRFGLGNLIRYVPHTVVGGFLAGTGWLLVKGGAGVLTGVSLTIADASTYLRPSVAAKWGAGLAFAVALTLILRRTSSLLALPAAIGGAIALFYVALLVSGEGIAGAETGGWLMGPFPDVGLLRFDTPAAFGAADWTAILAGVPDIATLCLVAVLSLLLNASGIELAMGTDADLNRELRAAGVGNVFGGAAGGSAGYHALSMTVLAVNLRARNRSVGVVAAAICALVLLFGASPLGLFPRPVMGGLLVFLGLGFMIEWLVEARSRLQPAEYLVVVGIVLMVASVGFLEGVTVGLVAAVVMFVVQYSRTDVVKHTLTGATFQSNVERPAAEREVLRARGEALHILELQGHVFFGTANRLLEQIRDRTTDSAVARLRALVLDFRRVDAVDSSAALALAKTRALAEAEGFTLVLTGESPQLGRRLELALPTDELVRRFPDLDHATQWYEDELLAASGTAETATHRRLSERLTAELGIEASRLMRYLRRRQLAPGEQLVRQGDPADAVFFVESGQVTAQLSSEDRGPVRLRTMGPGTVIGEVPLYAPGAARTASVVAETPCTVYRLSVRTLRLIEDRDPELAASLHRLFARLLAGRLSDTLSTMRALLA
jgi:SulP family sulfate permease